MAKVRYPELWDREWIEREYVLNQRTQVDIAQQLGCNHRAIGKSLERFEIPIRHPGKRTHGLYYHELYPIWRSMHQRCNDPNLKAHPDYGGRGIKVCDRWSGPDGFPNFLADMGERPKGLTLERINNNGNYEPDNCRWATPTEQQRNRRNTRLTEKDVVEIRRRCAAGENQRLIAKDYNIHQATVSQIHRGERWG